MAKSIASGSGKKRRVDFSNLESAVQSGKYENVDEVIAQSLIPKLEGMSLSLDQLQKNLAKLDRENKLLRKETENLRLKSTFLPKTVKIECPKCKTTIDSPNEFVSHLESAHFYVEQECVIDRPGLSVKYKVAHTAPPVQSFGEALAEPAKPLTTTRIPRKPLALDILLQPSNDNTPKPQIPEKRPQIPEQQFAPNPAYSMRMPSADPITHIPRHPTRINSSPNMRIMSPAMMPVNTHPHMHPFPRMKFAHKPPPNPSLYTNAAPNQQISRLPYNTPSKDNPIRTSPNQSGTIARARTAAPLAKTSPKVSHLSPGSSLARTPLHTSETTPRTKLSPIDLTETVELSNNASEKGYQTPLKYNPSLPIPQITVAVNVTRNLVISWSLTKEQNISVVSFYEIRAYQSADANSTPAVGEWKRIGLVRAMCPPMACTMCRIATGKLYSFVVRSIDKFGWHGPYSEVQSIQV